VIDALGPVLPDAGLRRGTVVAVGGAAATSLALALAAAPSVAGSWVGAVGMPSLGLLAAASSESRSSGCLLVAAPPPGEWATVVATLIDGVDVVLVRLPRSVRTGEARRLQARGRQRGAVLIVVGPPHPLEPDVTLAVEEEEWVGLAEGAGHLQGRRVGVVAVGRRAARAIAAWLCGCPMPTAGCGPTRRRSCRSRCGGRDELPPASCAGGVVPRLAGDGGRGGARRAGRCRARQPRDGGVAGGPGRERAARTPASGGQSRCPDLVVVAHDPARDARAFEPVLQAVATLTPQVELTDPGVCTFGTRGPSRYHGGDEALAAGPPRWPAEALGPGVTVAGPPGVGVADGPLRARAWRPGAPPGPIRSSWRPGRAPKFLAPSRSPPSTIPSSSTSCPASACGPSGR
jgi:hypothetical protein